MSNQHTPGPWHYSMSRQIFTPDGEVLRVSGVALPCGGVSPDDESFANARLIAAAPDLLDALSSFPGFTDNADIGDLWIEKVRAVIAKATGKEDA